MTEVHPMDGHSAHADSELMAGALINSLYLLRSVAAVHVAQVHSRADGRGSTW